MDGNLWRWDGLFISSSYEANISSILAELKEKRLNDLKNQKIEWQRVLELTNQKVVDLNDRIKTAKEELEISQTNPGDIDSKRQFLLNKINELGNEKNFLIMSSKKKRIYLRSYLRTFAIKNKIFL